MIGPVVDLCKECFLGFGQGPKCPCADTNDVPVNPPHEAVLTSPVRTNAANFAT